MGQRTPPRQFIQIPINGGVETRIDSAQVPQPKLLEQLNMSARATGALTPRYGHTAMVALGLQDAAIVDATNDELLASDSTGLYGYSATSSQFIRRGDYCDYGLSVQNIINQAVNQNYTPSQVGGVRNLSTAIVGNVGIAVWDTGPGRNNGSYTGGLVYITCYDAQTARIYWTTSTTGYAPITGNFAVNGFQTPSSVSVTGVSGASQPMVLAHAGKFILGMITTSLVTTSVTVSSTTTTGWGYISNLFYMTPDGITGIPPMPTFGVSVTNATSMFATYPINIMASGTTVNSGNASLFETINNFYDVTSNGTDLTFVASYASVNSSNALVYGNPTLYAQCWQDPTAAGVVSAATGTLPSQNGSAATGAYPLTIASIPGVTVASVATAYGATAVKTYGAGAGNRGVFSASTVAWYGKQNNTTIGTTGQVTWPLAVSMTGTSTNFTGIMTDGYLVNQWTYSAAGGVSNSSILESYLNLPMTSTRQVPLGPGAGQSTVASRMFWIPAAGSPKGSGVVEPAVWLYVGSPAAGTSNAAYPGGVAPPGAGGGFNSFTNLILARINLAAYSAAKQNVNLSEVVARCFYLRALPVRYGTMRPPDVLSYSGGYTTPAMQLTNVADSIVSIKLVSVKAGQLRNVIPLPQGALLTGADTRYYDGLTVRSAGWLRLPEIGGSGLTATTQTGANLAANFQYTYFFVYTEYDNYGNAMYSSTSPPYTVTTLTGANNAVQIDMNEFWPSSSKLNTIPAGIQIFRNTSLNPLQYYRVTQMTSVGATAQYGQQYYIDVSADDISGNALLYSPPSGGELPNDPAPPSTCAVATKQRVYVASAENPSYIYPSKPFYAGRAPIEFNAAQYVDIDPASGAINGLANLDDTVVIFKQKAIYLLSGDGPDATGVGAFNKPYRLSVDIGLQDPHSVISTERGVFFRSQRGIELLDRGGASVTYVGAPVEVPLAGNVITDAFIVPNQAQVRFVYGNAAMSGQATQLVYDYVSQIWYRYILGYQSYVYTNPTGIWFNGSVYHGMTSSGTAGIVLQETPGVYAERNNPVISSMQTPFIPVAENMHGWGRVRRINILGKVADPCTITVGVSYDYDTSTTTTIRNVSLSTTGEFQVRVRTLRQVCQAISVTLSIQPANGATMQGPTISSIELETSMKSGALRRPDTASY